MASETLQLNAALEQMLTGKATERSGEAPFDFDLRGTLADTEVHEAGYGEFLALLRQTGQATHA